MKHTPRVIATLALLAAGCAPLSADKYDYFEFRVILTSAAVTPAPAVSGSGTAWVRISARINDSNGVAAAWVQVIVGAVTSETRPAWAPVRLVEGASGQPGSRIAEFEADPFPPGTFGGFVPGTAPPGATRLGPSSDIPFTNVAAIQRLIDNPSAFHLAVATTANPNGIARGQLRAVRVAVVGGGLSPLSVVPPVNVDAFGEATLDLSDYGDYLRMYVCVVKDFRALTGGARIRLPSFWLHSGKPGTNGPALINIAFLTNFDYERAFDPGRESDPLGSDCYPKQFTSPADLEILRTLMVQPGDYYLLMTSEANPTGVLRGQLGPTEEVRFDSTLTAQNVSPPAANFGASALASLRAFVTRRAGGDIASATFSLEGLLDLPSDQSDVALSIHQGPVGTAGPAALRPSRQDGTPRLFPGGRTHFLRSAIHIVFGPRESWYAAIRALVANPGNYYFNIRSMAHPQGFLRGQVSTALPRPAVSERGIINAAGSTAAAAAPRGLTSVFGANLASASGVVPLTAQGELAEVFNGTEVTVGGMPAKLLFASPGQLNIQIPELAPGRHPLIVKTPTGASPARDLQVTGTAPGIFVITKGDFSLVTQESPAAEGDPLILWTTGLGASSPRVAPGVRAPADPLAIPAVPEVLLGDIPARVVAVALAPGFAGVEQVVVIATGASGPVEVRLRTPDGVSNVQTIHVR